MRRAPQKARPLTNRLRTHLGSRPGCPCVRCEAADEIGRLRIELWEAYEQQAILMLGAYRTTEPNPPETWAEIADGLPEQIRNSAPPTH